uniref:Putative DNA ligase n=1 Tax=viral metagenome TaxID=1070528 RepID=A0A6H1ZQ57_9ZZZZ
MITGKTIMIIGGAVESLIAIKVAKSLGLKTFVTDGNTNAVGSLTADNFAVVSTYDHEGNLEAARDYEGNIVGVMTVAADVPYTVAYVAQGLDLPHIPLDAAIALSDKVIMKNVLKDKVPIPIFKEIYSPNDLKDFSKKVGFPFVVKPVDGRGSRGVQLVKEGMDFVDVFNLTKKASPSGGVMVEEFLKGDQLSVEGFVIDGRAYLPAIFDRNYEYLKQFSPYIIENGGEMPSKYQKDFKVECESVMTNSAKALGIKDGVVKGDFVINDGVIKVIEIAGRLSGGFFGTVATPYSTGVNPVENVMRWSMGEVVDVDKWIPTREVGACIRFVFFPLGNNMEKKDIIVGMNIIKENPYCIYSGVLVNNKDNKICCHADRNAVVVAGGKDRTESILNADILIDKLVSLLSR